METPSLQKLLDDIKAEIASGNKIQAIKLYRDATGAGLAEAKEAVELIAAGKPPRDGAPAADGEALPRMKERIASGNMIDAIKLYRGAHGVDLKDAKDAVEAIAAEMLRKGEISEAASLARDAGFRRMRLAIVLALAILLGIAAAILAFVMVPTGGR
jgi:ribosomal protein L7/L12